MRRPGAQGVVWLAVGLAVVSIVLAAAPLPRRFAGDSGLPPPDPPLQPGPADAPVSIDPILELSPFGRLIRAVGGPPETQETSLGLTLHGVVIAARPEASIAIVSGPDGPARVYRIGEEIAGSATLDAVFGDHVALRVDGRTETLSFPESRAAGAQAPTTTDDGVNALRALVTGAATGDTAVSEPASEGAATDIGATLERYRGAIRDDPQAVLDELGLIPFDEGYHVDATASDVLLRAGLLPGDVVATVNGQQVGDIERDRQYFDDVTASGRARIEVVREGQRLVLSFPLR